MRAGGGKPDSARLGKLAQLLATLDDEGGSVGEGVATPAQINANSTA